MEFYIFNARGTPIEVDVNIAYLIPMLQRPITVKNHGHMDRECKTRICYGEVYINQPAEQVHSFVSSISGKYHMLRKPDSKLADRMMWYEALIMEVSQMENWMTPIVVDGSYVVRRIEPLVLDIPHQNADKSRRR